MTSVNESSRSVSFFGWEDSDVVRPSLAMLGVQPFILIERTLQYSKSNAVC